MKRIIVIVLAVLSLAGCGHVRYEQHRTPDGRIIECFRVGSGNRGGISCNWQGQTP